MPETMLTPKSPPSSSDGDRHSVVGFQARRQVSEPCRPDLAGQIFPDRGLAFAQLIQRFSLNLANSFPANIQHFTNPG